MVDQANEWLPLITPGAAVDGWSWGDRWRKRQRGGDGGGGGRKDFPHFDYFRPFQSRLKNNFGRGDCLCHTFTVSRIERASAVFNLTQLSQNKPTCYIQHYLKTIAWENKRPLWKPPPVFRSNAAIKISYIANTHSTGLLLTQWMTARLYRMVTVKGGGNRICWGLIGFTTPWVSWPVSWVRAPNSD